MHEVCVSFNVLEAMTIQVFIIFKTKVGISKKNSNRSDDHLNGATG